MDMFFFFFYVHLFYQSASMLVVRLLNKLTQGGMQLTKHSQGKQLSIFVIFLVGLIEEVKNG